MPRYDPTPSADDAPDAGVAFVLRCRREKAAQAMGPGRLHIRLQQVGAERSWRFTDLDQTFETLRAEIARLLDRDDAND